MLAGAGWCGLTQAIRCPRCDTLEQLRGSPKARRDVQYRSGSSPGGAILRGCLLRRVRVRVRGRGDACLPGWCGFPGAARAFIGCPTIALRHARGDRLHGGTPNLLASNGLRRILSTNQVLNARTPGTGTPPVPPPRPKLLLGQSRSWIFSPLWTPKVITNDDQGHRI